jgi:hypothetical protein
MKVTQRSPAPTLVEHAILAALAAVVLTTLGACATTLRPTSPRGELELRLGPVDLPPSPAGEEHSHAKMSEVKGRYRVAQAGWITSFVPSMVHADGSAAPGKLLHHVAVAALHQSDFLCTEHPHKMPRLIMAAGGEQTSVEIPEGFGIPVDAGQELAAFGMFANHLGEPHEDVSFLARMGFIASGSGTLRAVVPVWIDVDETCPEEGYEVGAGEHVRQRTFRFPFSGTLRYAGGHMHDGGQLLRIFEKDSGRELVLHAPVYDEQGTIASIPVYDEPDGRPVSTETDFVIEATYRNPGHHALRGMGLVVALVEPTEGASTHG